MYDYRQMTREEREKVVSERKARRWPWHSPPHFEGTQEVFLLSAACYEHREILHSASRLTEFTEALLTGLSETAGGHIYAWVVQPNHYHLLVRVALKRFGPWIARLHNGKATQWNREDQQTGRKVWCRYSDRRIRSERHYYATLNYIHANPLKHGFAVGESDWPWSSHHSFLDEFGRETLDAWEKRYPVRDYGAGWDDWRCEWHVRREAPHHPVIAQRQMDRLTAALQT